jgi:type I restriction enzyme R subunit
MTPNPYSEDHLVEQPALALLAELGWQTACGSEETFAPQGGSLGRRDRREVVLLPRLRDSLERLNPGQPPEAISAAIAQVLDHSITGIAIRDQGPPSIDLSKIDFQALADKFKTKRHKKTELEELKALIAAHLARMVQLNPTRADFRETFEALIASYNAGSRSVEEIYKQLLQLSLQLSQEQQRHIRENLSEEELAMFDILLQSAPDLSDSDRAKVKQSARELVETIKQLLVLNWQQKSDARAKLKLLIEDALDIGLPRAYSPELYQQKCEAVFAHIEQAYPERDRSVYAVHG